MHLKPTQFVDTPVGHDGAVARLAGGMLWFAAYEVIENGARRTVPLADVDRALGSNVRAATLHQRITSPRSPLTLGARALRFDQPLVAGILNVPPDSFSAAGGHQDYPADRKRVVSGKSVSVRVDLGGGRNI